MLVSIVGESVRRLEWIFEPEQGKTMDFKREVRLPAAAIGAMLVLGLLSVLFAPGLILTVLWGGLLGLNAVKTMQYFGGEVKRLKAAHVGHGPVDKAALRKDALKSQAVPTWMILTLALGSLWAIVAVIKFVGFLVGLLLIVAIVGGLAAAAYFGYRAAKKHGLL